MSVCFPDNAIWPDPTVMDAEAIANGKVTGQQVEIALSLAWTTLQTLSAYQIAICPAQVRPCKKSCSQGVYYVAPVVGGRPGSPFFPEVRNGLWTNVWCGHHDDCSCSEVQEIRLPGPVGGINYVSIDGVALPANAYRVDDGNKLVRQDGLAWPTCQDMNLVAGEPGTFVVSYYHGSVSDITVRYAAGILADEFLKAILGNDECRLPAGTTSIVRQGVTIEARQDFFDLGTTGIAEVDSVVRRFNPNGKRLPSRVFSLDGRSGRRSTILNALGGGGGGVID